MGKAVEMKAIPETSLDSGKLQKRFKFRRSLPYGMTRLFGTGLAGGERGKKKKHGLAWLVGITSNVPKWNQFSILHMPGQDWRWGGWLADVIKSPWRCVVSWAEMG